LLRNGEIVKKLNPDIIANTAVNGSAFKNVIPELESAELISSQEDMMRLQSALQTRGLYAGVIDGELGRGTRSAILNFEASIGLQQTGLPTMALLRRFGDDRMRPAHMYSNGRGVVTETGETTAAPPPAANVQVPTPLKRPPMLIRKPNFNPFSNF
jgi:peptidoglycan hydrolase-like protein with peptidoglycan-binding domain